MGTKTFSEPFEFLNHLTLKDMPAAPETLHDVGCMRGGERISDAGVNAALIMYYEYLRLKERVRALEERITNEHSCAECGACLMLNEYPPHCEDCHPDEEQEIAWQKWVKKWDKELEEKLQIIEAGLAPKK